MKLNAEQSKKVNELRRLVNKEFSLYGKVVFADYDTEFGIHTVKMINRFGSITELNFHGSSYANEQMLSNVTVLESSRIDMSYAWQEDLRNALDSIDFDYSRIF